MDRFDDEVIRLGEISGPDVRDRVAAWGRKLYAEGLAAGLAEGEAERKELADTLARELAAENERLEYLEGQDRSLLEQHQASMITLGDSDLLAVGGRLLDRAEKAETKLRNQCNADRITIEDVNRANERTQKAEAKLVIALREMESYKTHYEQRGLLLQEAEAKLADKSREADQLAGIVGDAYKTGRHDGMGALAATEVKRGQDIMEFEREKKALNAELAANEDWHKKYLRLQGDNCDLERELAKLTAELAAEKAKRETAEERGIFVDKRATDMAIEKDALAQELKGARAEEGRMREALEAAQEELKEGLAGGCNGSHAPTLSIVEDALSPEPEKPEAKS